ncbi:serine/threonine-protein kinase [Streptomyces hokutonensis]|uniref:serine/threonine-protein kinase n=1 Tax=Streptomyces hokutonensis TaxID=1306990 RepID=UPI0004769973|nr:serine/threonine-protein kinase [Streptomyces hokutonensis]
MSSGESGRVDGVGRLLAGRYRVVARLGWGGMGVVWRAVDEVLGREVAVKELRTFTDDYAPQLADLRLRMQREARAAARVRHPGVVAVHDIAEVDGRPLIVMELIDGPSLDDVLGERGPIDPREAAGIGAKVMEALAAAHAAGVLHRDVKPGNILLERSGRVVLTDFGIATMDDPGDGSATHLTRSGELIGSLDYLAPERAQGADPGPASDVWALGATLYAAVEGASPFRRTSTYSTLTAIVDEPLPEPHRAGPLTPVLRQLLDKRPELRPDADQARRLLEAVAQAPETDSATTVLRGAGGGAAAVAVGFGAGAPTPSGSAGPEARVKDPQESTAARTTGLGSAAQLDVPAGAGEPSAAGTSGNPPGPGAQAPGSPVPPAGSDALPLVSTPAPTSVPQGFGPPLAPMPAPTPPTGPMAHPAHPRRKARVLIAAAAAAVVLAGAGVVVAHYVNSGDASVTSQGGSPPAQDAGDTSPTARADAKRSDSAKPTGQGADGTQAPTEQHTGKGGDPTAGHSPTASPSRSTSSGGGGTGGNSTPTTGTSPSSSPAPACQSIGGGKYNCQVWRTAKSYTASGTEVGVLGAGTNYFYCQVNLGRRETYGQWTNVWWAKTDDDSGNTNVYVSDVYIKGGGNDEPVPGLPVC